MTKATSPKKKKARAKRKKKLRISPKPMSVQDIMTRAQRFGPAAIDGLADIAANGSDAARVSAINSLLDRGFGKVGQPIELTGANGGPVPLELGISPAVAAALQAIKEAAE